MVKFDLKNITSIDRCPKLYLLKYGMQAFLQIRAYKCLPEKFYAIFYTTDSLYTRMDMQDCHSTSLEPLVHCQNVGQNVKTFSKYHFYRSYFGRCHLNWLNWFHFLFIEGGLIFILIVCMIFLLPFLDVTICVCQTFLSSPS